MLSVQTGRKTRKQLGEESAVRSKLGHLFDPTPDMSLSERKPRLSGSNKV